MKSFRIFEVLDKCPTEVLDKCLTKFSTELLGKHISVPDRKPENLLGWNYEYLRIKFWNRQGAPEEVTANFPNIVHIDFIRDAWGIPRARYFLQNGISWKA